MPCRDPTHVHNWPTQGTLVIEKCERLCGYCVDAKAEHEWKFPWFLRRHVRNFHKNEFPDLDVSDNWTTGQAEGQPASTSSHASRKPALPKKAPTKKVFKTKPKPAKVAKGSPKIDKRVKQLKGAKEGGKGKKRARSSSPDGDYAGDAGRARISDGTNTPSIVIDHNDADVTMNDAESSGSSFVFEPTFEFRLSNGSGRGLLSSSSSMLRPPSGRSQFRSAAPANNQPGQNDSNGDRLLRIPVFEIDGQEQTDPIARHYSMVDMKLSWRDALRDLTKQGSEHDLYPCEMGVIMADEVERLLTKRSSDKASTASATNSPESAGGAEPAAETQRPGSNCPFSRPSTSSDGQPPPSREAILSAFGPKIYKMSERLDQLVWDGFGSAFMHQLFSPNLDQVQILTNSPEPLASRPGSSSVSRNEIRGYNADQRSVHSSGKGEMRLVKSSKSDYGHQTAQDKMGNNSSSYNSFRSATSFLAGSLRQTGLSDKAALEQAKALSATSSARASFGTVRSTEREDPAYPQPLSRFGHEHRGIQGQASSVNRNRTLSPMIQDASGPRQPLPSSFSFGETRGMCHHGNLAQHRSNSELSDQFGRARSPLLPRPMHNRGGSGHDSSCMHPVHHYHGPHATFPLLRPQNLGRGHTTFRSASVDEYGVAENHDGPSLQPGTYSFRPYYGPLTTQPDTADQQQLAAEEAGKQLLAIHETPRDFSISPPESK